MKVKYDAEVDVMRIIFSESEISKSDEEKQGIIRDYIINIIIVSNNPLFLNNIFGIRDIQK